MLVNVSIDASEHYLNAALNPFRFVSQLDWTTAPSNITNLCLCHNLKSLLSLAPLHSLTHVFLCVSGLSMESETGLSPVETDTDSHKPLMSDEEEDEVEVYGARHQPAQELDEPLEESPQAIGFFQAFCLPGVLPVSPISQD